MSNLGNVLKNQRVLVAEDAVFISLALEAIFNAAGASKVFVATSLTEAKALAKREPFDVAVLDIRFPDGTSYDFAEELLQKNTPMVIYSAHMAAVQNDQLAGAVFCEKPALPAEIVQAVLASIDMMMPMRQRYQDRTTEDVALRVVEG